MYRVFVYLGLRTCTVAIWSKSLTDVGIQSGGLASPYALLASWLDSDIDQAP